METFEVPNLSPRNANQPKQLTVTTRWKRREWGGWNLVEHRTGRVLGWIVRDDAGTGWIYRICSSAFRGDGPDDRGHVMDQVPCWLYYGSYDNSLASEAAGDARNRWTAAHSIVWHLVQNHAPAVGFGQHGAVVMSRWNPKSPTYDTLLADWRPVQIVVETAGRPLTYRWNTPHPLAAAKAYTQAHGAKIWHQEIGGQQCA